jgi:Na+-driven multidrug efflux pump
LLRLAGPTTSVMALQIVVALVDIWIVARLGTDTLAGMALVFPVMALMVNSANGAMGGSVASALAPEAWSRLFTTEPDVLAASVAYVTRAAPAYCFFGLGLTIYFASQGANRMAAPVLAAFLRLAVATAGGWFAAERLGLGLDGLFAATGCSLALYGTLIAAALLVMPWRAKSRTI